jgi:hypothetical protein
VTGLQKITGPVSPFDSKPSKTALPALCPSGKRVIGGGGWVVTANGANDVALTEVRPVHPASGQDSYVVTAQELTATATENWSVQAFAICASPVSGLTIQSSVSNSFAEGEVFCPSGQKVLGSGGRVNNPANHVALNEVTPFLEGDRVRVAATDTRPGAANVWTVTSYAVCAPAPAGYQVVFAPSAQHLSEPQKVAFVTCPAGTSVHGAAAVAVPGLLGASASPVVLQVIYPFNGLDKVEAFAVESIPTDGNWDVRAVAICAA